MVNGIGGVVLGNVVQAGSVAGDINVSMAEAVPTQLALNGLPSQPVFVGRLEQVTALEQLLAQESPVAVVAVDGLGGIGKTALVIHVANQARKRFPGGVAMIDMRGYEAEDQKVTAFVALGRLLTALGVHREQIPADTDERSRLWRSLLEQHDVAARRMLVVIDNVSSLDQVLPLLPGESGHRVLVTSRHRLAGLQGARLLTLPTLPADSATDLLVIGLDKARERDERVRADQAATAELVRLCGGLPLALRTATVLLAVDPERPVRDLVAALEDEHHRLEELEVEGDVSVRAAFNLSYRMLDADHQRVLRLLALNPGPQVSTEAAARLLDRTPRQAQKMIERLQRASLVARGAHGLWQMHDLLRLYAAELAERNEERPGAVDRLLRHYVSEAGEAARHIDPRVPPTERGSRFKSRTEAVTWTDVEYPNLLAAATLAEENGHDETLRDLSIALDQYFDLRRQPEDWISLGEAAARACVRLGDQAGETAVRTSLGNAYQVAGRSAEALAQHERVLELSRANADRYMEASALSNMGNAKRALGDTERAIELFEQSLAIRRELGDQLGEGRTLTNLGVALSSLGRDEDASETLERSLVTTIGYYERDLAVSKTLGDERAEIITLCHLGLAKRKQGLLDEAARHYENALEVARALGDRVGEAVATHGLADIRENSELRSQAHELAHDVVPLSELLPQPPGADLDAGEEPLTVEQTVEVLPMCCGRAPDGPGPAR